MSKFFKITGDISFNKSFELNSKYASLEMADGFWVKPSPNFNGEVIVNGDDFYGYTDDHYGKQVRRYIIGKTIQENGKTALAFYRLSNESTEHPQLFVIPHLGTTKSSYWCVHGLFDWYSPMGETRVDLDKIDGQLNEEIRIRKIFSQLDLDVCCNSKFQSNTQYLHWVLKEALKNY